MKAFILITLFAAAPARAGAALEPKIRFQHNLSSVYAKINYLEASLGRSAKILTDKDNESEQIRALQGKLGQFLVVYRAELDISGKFYTRSEVLTEPDAHQGDHAKIRETLTASHEKILRYNEEVKALKQSFYMRRLMTTFAEIQKDGASDAAGEKLSTASTFDHFVRSIAALKKDVSSFMGAESDYWNQLRGLAKRRKQRTRTMAGVALLVVLGLAGVFWTAGRGSPEKAEGASAGDPLSGPVTPPAVSGPLGAGPVSGPVAGTAETSRVIGGNFRIEGELGRGGMGLVYLARDITLGRRVAIKKLHSDGAADDGERFLAEARLVAALKHPGIVEIHSIIRESGELYLVFEYIEGRTLDEELRAKDKLPLDEVRRIAAPIAAALDYAHSRRIIHRDLKPANILLGADGAKITDFGIAHQAKRTVAKLTRADTFGTPPYMAPEQEQGKISKASDIFALGVCCYEMLTGKLPFLGPNYLAQKKEMAFAKPSAEGLPASLDAVFDRALQAETSKRFHSGEEFMTALGEA